MAQPQPRYDVAISFLAPREGLAQELSQSLAGQATTFVYSERQRELVGRDGQEAFSVVFASQARLVVVLYEAGWGETRWTRVEQTAIQERGFESGWNFLVVASLDDSSTPAWLPKTRIWFSFQKFGVAGLAAVIEGRLAELDAEPRVDTAVDLAARLAAQQKREAVRSHFLSSKEGCDAGELEVGKLFDEIERLHAEASKALPYSLERDGCRAVWLFRIGFTISVHWHRMYANTLDGSCLVVVLHRGRYGPGRYANVRPVERLAEEEIRFDVDEHLRPRWVESQHERKVFSSNALADHITRQVLQARPTIRE